MEIWQNWKAFGLEEWARQALQRMPEEKRPDRCTACGACEEKCPNDLHIRERLEELKALL
jgi:NAD-dependent dihydropyrimidine dehydrogenase PreA subunit